MRFVLGMESHFVCKLSGLLVYIWLITYEGACSRSMGCFAIFVNSSKVEIDGLSKSRRVYASRPISVSIDDFLSPSQ